MFTQLRTAAMVTAVAGTPYVATQTEWGRETVASVSQTIQSGYLPADNSGAAHAHHEVEKLVTATSNQYRYDTPLVQNLGQVQLPQAQPGQAQPGQAQPGQAHIRAGPSQCASRAQHRRSARDRPARSDAV